MENTLSEIRQRENYLVVLKKDQKLYVGQYGSIRLCSIFELSDEEKEYLKQGCIKEIERLRKLIECLTDGK